MNKYNSFLIGWASALFLTLFIGCSKEEQFDSDKTSDHQTPLSISVSNDLMSKSGGVISTNTLSSGSSIGLFLTKTSDGSPYFINHTNIQSTASGSGSSQIWSPSKPTWLNSTPATVYAYYPYSESVTNVESIPVDVTKNIDYLWAQPVTDVLNSQPDVELQMKHAMSVIRFSLFKGEYTGAGIVSSLTVQGDCIAPTAKLNAKTGALTVANPGNEVSFANIGSLNALSSTAQTIEQLVVPTGSSGKITVFITLDGKIYRAATYVDFTLEQSKSYSFELVCSEKNISITNVTVEPIVDTNQGDYVSKVTFSWDDAKATDGVYALTADGLPVPYENATASSYTGVVFSVKGKLYQVSKTYFNSPMQNSYSDNTYLPNYTTVDGFNSSGYLTTSGGTPTLNINYSQWSAALSTIGAGQSFTDYFFRSGDPICGSLNDFRYSSATNLGYTDWFIPALGELAYMCLKEDEINALLNKCGFTTLSNVHWSSTEYGTDTMWSINFSNKYVTRSQKSNRLYVRCIRYFSY